LGNLFGPQVHPVLYLQHSPHDASPKAISGRTSYLQVRLAYHPYPHLILHFCNSERFGPPREVSLASPWTWVAHLVSCLIHATCRPLQTRFRCGCGCPCLNLATQINSPAHSPKGTRSGFPPVGGIALPPIVSARFQVLFHSPNRGSFHLSLTVLVRYRSSRVFSLGEWSPLFPTGLACPVVLRISAGRCSLSSTGLSPCAARLSSPLRLAFHVPCAGPATPPEHCSVGLGFFPFARHYSGNLLFSWGY
jgi:hypothetical protein